MNRVHKCLIWLQRTQDHDAHDMGDVSVPRMMNMFPKYYVGFTLESNSQVRNGRLIRYN